MVGFSIIATWRLQLMSSLAKIILVFYGIRGKYLAGASYGFLHKVMEIETRDVAELQELRVILWSCSESIRLIGYYVQK